MPLKYVWKMDYKKIILPHILNLKPYSSARDEFKGKEGVFLDANENPFETGDFFNRYPDPLQQDLKKRISEIKKIPVEQIFIGNGSDEPIDLLIRMTCANQNGNLIILPPTYGMYEVSANINHAKIIQVPLKEDFQINLNNLLNSINEATKLIFICSPNNPTGNKINRSSIYSILNTFKQGFVIIDEAYIDFNDEESFALEINNYPNLIVLQTLSKAYGMASLRLGMAFAHSDIIEILNKIKPPYNISGATQKLVLKELSNLTTFHSNLKSIKENKEYLIKKLKEIKEIEQVYPSNANFILVKFKQSKSLFEHLIHSKIITRYRGNVTLCENSIRISIGTREEIDKLLISIKNYYV